MNLRERFDTFVKTFRMFSMVVAAATTAWVAPPTPLPVIHRPSEQVDNYLPIPGQCYQFIDVVVVPLAASSSDRLVTTGRPGVPVTATAVWLGSGNTYVHSVTIML